MVKKIGIKIVLLVIVVTLLNCIYQFTLLKRDIGQMAPCAYQCLKLPKNVDYVYFGESSNFTTDRNDSTTLSISELIGYYSNKKIIAIDTPAVHAGIYKYWIKQLNNAKPKGIIVTMNLRSFGEDWINSNLETNLNRGVRILKSEPILWNRFLLSLKNFEDEITNAARDSVIQKQWRTKQLHFPYEFKYKTVKQWDNAIAMGLYEPQGQPWDSKRIELTAHLVKNYAFNIDEENPRVKDFDEIARWGLKNNVKVYFNLLAENVQLADSLVGENLVFLMKNNRDFLVKRYVNLGAVVVDNLEKVDHKSFLEKNWPTEHYDYKGRINIAKIISNKLN